MDRLGSPAVTEDKRILLFIYEKFEGTQEERASSIYQASKFQNYQDNQAGSQKDSNKQVLSGQATRSENYVAWDRGKDQSILNPISETGTMFSRGRVVPPVWSPATEACMDALGSLQPTTSPTKKTEVRQIIFSLIFVNNFFWCF